MIDLHLHTSMSDGTDSPQELLKKTLAAGCEIISVTDHDDIRAYSIISGILPCGGVKLIAGVELSVVFRGRDMHLLCYNFNPDFPEFKNVLKKGGDLRHQKVREMFVHLEKNHNIFIPENEKAEILKLNSPGKLHIFDAVKRMGNEMGRNEYFAKCYRGFDSQPFKIQAEEAIEAVARAGGVTSFAHPHEAQREHRLDFEQIDFFTRGLAQSGMTAIEVFHSSHSEQDISEYKKIAKKYGLSASGGSDYHGDNKPVKIGQLSNCGIAPKQEELTILSALQ